MLLMKVRITQKSYDRGENIAQIKEPQKLRRDMILQISEVYRPNTTIYNLYSIISFDYLSIKRGLNIKIRPSQGLLFSALSSSEPNDIW